jgi:Ca2+-binding RTX toxin-like protein
VTPVPNTDLQNSYFTALTTGTLDAGLSTRCGSTRADARTASSQHDDGALFYDADGVGCVAAVQFADLDNNATLTSADFVVV